MELHFLIPTVLNTALPKIVMPAIIAETSEAIKTEVKSPLEEIAMLAKMLAPAAPDKIPQTSPITSQIEPTLSAFLIKLSACLLPLTFLALIAVNGSMLQVATAKPNISNKMLIEIKTKITIIATIIDALESEISLKIPKPNEIEKANNKIIIGQTHAFGVFCFLSFFILINA